VLIENLRSLEWKTEQKMAKRTPLVCQQLENISREALGKYQDIIRQYVRRRHGVYALYRRGKLHYVGLASNLRSRLAHHLRDRHQDSWDRFSVYLTIVTHLALILRIVKPMGKKVKDKLANAMTFPVDSYDLETHYAPGVL
jgi:hypothetical protein